MPNIIFNEIYFCGDADEIRALTEEITAHKNNLLNHFVPMPESLNITANSNGYIGHKAIQAGVDLSSLTKEQVELGTKYIENITKYGYPTWYEWRNANWGVKWEASEVIVDSDDSDSLLVCFRTPWNTPFPVLETISRQYPRVSLKIRRTHESGDFDDFYGINGIIE